MGWGVLKLCRHCIFGSGRDPLTMQKPRELTRTNEFDWRSEVRAWRRSPKCPTHPPEDELSSRTAEVDLGLLRRVSR